jgi:hypothetical protein
MPDCPPTDITPVIREGARRLTYVEMASLRGISRASAERLVRRKGWPRQIGNDGIVRVTVPPNEIAPNKQTNIAHRAPGHPSPDRPPNPPVVTPDIMAVIREVVTPLTIQLERERDRVDRAEQRIAELEVALADARSAERIASGEAAALRAEVEHRKEFSFRRRLWWALRPKRAS